MKACETCVYEELEFEELPCTDCIDYALHVHYKTVLGRYREALEQIYDLTHAFDDQNDYAKTLADIAFNALEEK